MRNFISFVKTTFLGGVIVLLPAAILVLVFQWVFRFVANLIQPLSHLIVRLLEPLAKFIPYTQLQGFISDLLSISIILATCFVVGVGVKTQLGGWLFHNVENFLLRIAPGYTMVKEIVLQLFGSDTLVTTFITDEHPDGSYTVFMPTGPNPTSGWIFHVPGKDVQLVDISVEHTMRTVIGCGVGSKPLIQDFKRKTEEGLN